MAGEHEAHEPADGVAFNGFELNVELTGNTPMEIIETLEMVVLPMLRGGIVHANNESITTGTRFHFFLEPKGEGGIFIDGEGMIVCVNNGGEIVCLIRPDGTEDDTVQQLKLSGVEWGLQHQGMLHMRAIAGGEPWAAKPTRDQLEFLDQKCLAEGNSWPEDAV